MVEGADHRKRRKEKINTGRSAQNVPADRDRYFVEQELSQSDNGRTTSESIDQPETSEKHISLNTIPPGWNYNPAAWSQRLPIIILAIIGFLVAAYLALYQFRIITSVWEPFFANGSVVILNSPISHILPIPDAALGAFSYLIDAVAGIIGSQRRWRTMPWMVILFGIAVGPLGFVSVMLVIFQPVLFNAWCTLCIFTAIISVVMIGPSMDEVLASLQYLRRVKDSGKSLWRGFWGFSDVVQTVK